MKKLFLDLARKDYDAFKRINWSTLKLMGRSPLHYATGLEAEREAKREFDIGNGAHALILEPDRFATDYISYPGARRAGEEWKAFLETYQGKEILKHEDFAAVIAMRKSVARHTAARELIGEAGHSEVTLLWDVEAGPAKFECKARPDRITKSAIIDVKTTINASKAEFGRQCEKLRYHAQAAYYVDAHREVTGLVLPYFIVAIEKAAPFAVSVFHVPEKLLDVGRDEYMTYLAKLDACRQSNTWPGYSDGIVELELPHWAATNFELEAA